MKTDTKQHHQGTFTVNWHRGGDNENNVHILQSVSHPRDCNTNEN